MSKDGRYSTYGCVVTAVPLAGFQTPHHPRLRTRLRTRLHAPDSMPQTPHPRLCTRLGTRLRTPDSAPDFASQTSL